MGQNAKRSKNLMKFFTFFTFYALQSVKSNDIEDITLERLLTYFKYDVCLAKGVEKKICNNVNTFLKSDCLKRADPGPCAAFRQFYGYDETTDRCKEFHFGGCRGNKNKFVKKNECKRKRSLDLEELVVAGLIKRGHRRTIINQRKESTVDEKKENTARAFVNGVWVDDNEKFQYESRRDSFKSEFNNESNEVSVGCGFNFGFNNFIT